MTDEGKARAVIHRLTGFEVGDKVLLDGEVGPLTIIELSPDKKYAELLHTNGASGPCPTSRLTLALPNAEGEADA